MSLSCFLLLISFKFKHVTPPVGSCYSTILWFLYFIHSRTNDPVNRYFQHNQDCLPLKSLYQIPLIASDCLFVHPLGFIKSRIQQDMDIASIYNVGWSISSMFVLTVYPLLFITFNSFGYFSRAHLLIVMLIKDVLNIATFFFKLFLKGYQILFMPLAITKKKFRNMSIGQYISIKVYIKYELMQIYYKNVEIIMRIWVTSAVRWIQTIVVSKQ